MLVEKIRSWSLCIRLTEESEQLGTLLYQSGWHLLPDGFRAKSGYDGYDLLSSTNVRIFLQMESCLLVFNIFPDSHNRESPPNRRPMAVSRRSFYCVSLVVMEEKRHSLATTPVRQCPPSDSRELVSKCE